MTRPAMTDLRFSNLPPQVKAMAQGGDSGNDGNELGVATKTKPKSKKPNLYKVLMLNDDYTPMEFAVLVLQRFFRMGLEDATRVMLQVHQRGGGACGTFNYEVAETNVAQVTALAHEPPTPQLRRAARRDKGCQVVG